MSDRRRLPPAVIEALGEIVAQGVASGMIDRHIPVRNGFIDATAPGEAARIAAHLAASPDAPEWAAVHEPLATLLRETIRLAAGPPSLTRCLGGYASPHASGHKRTPVRLTASRAPALRRPGRTSTEAGTPQRRASGSLPREMPDGLWAG
jgi:hypothetical protein